MQKFFGNIIQNNFINFRFSIGGFREAAQAFAIL
jgi:hypothetical protein